MGTFEKRHDYARKPSPDGNTFEATKVKCFYGRENEVPKQNISFEPPRNGPFLFALPGRLNPNKCQMQLNTPF
jgi:hypothetical protein